MRQWIIGRAPDCDIVVNVSEVSTRHCCLSETPHGFFLEDLTSSNGTFVNGQRLTSRQPITQGDKVTLGQHVPMPWPEDVATFKETTRKVFTIGRTDDNDIVFDHSMVSAHHARLEIDDGKARIVDLGSSNGTAIGHRNRKIKQADLAADNIVFLGSLRVPAQRLLKAALANAAEKLPTGITFHGDAMTIGRTSKCDVALNYPMISAEHARLTRANGQMFLEDLGSSNGTFVNHQRVNDKVPIKPGDIIGLGSFALTVQDGGVLKRRDYRGDVTLEACDLGVDVPGQRLIEGCSFTIFPSELVGLMGPSGSGKSTLLRALNGYTPPSEGQVFLNGQGLYEHFDEYRHTLGYVPQDDIIHANLTVYQALFYSARLRLPPDYTNDDINERIRSVLGQLHLEGTENVLIGSPEKKGISGGQRKRVNLAMELLTDPLVLFLDEPTSGLSSEDALVVMKVLRELANQGKTIFITIHQPSPEVFKLLDNLVIVGKDTNSPEPGRLLYYGPAYPDAIRFFNSSNNADSGDDLTPDAIFRGMSARPAAEWRNVYQQSAQHREYVAERAGTHPAKSKRSKRQRRRNVPLLSQWKTLVARSLAIKLRDRMNTAILLAQAPVVALLLVFVFGAHVTEPVATENVASVGVTIFLMSLAALWFGASNAVREIVGEWAVYQRERMVNLRILAYVASKFTVLGGLSMVQCSVLLLITYVGCDLHAPFPLLFLLFLSALVGVAIGLLLSALARTSEVAIGLLPIVLLAMVILGGAMLPVHKMHWAIRVPCIVNPARWSFESMVVTEAKNRPTFTPPALPTPPGVLPTPSAEPQDVAEHYFPKDRRRPVAVAILALAITLVLIGGGVVGVLWRRDMLRMG